MESLRKGWCGKLFPRSPRTEMLYVVPMVPQSKARKPDGVRIDALPMQLHRYLTACRSCRLSFKSKGIRNPPPPKFPWEPHCSLPCQEGPGFHNPKHPMLTPPPSLACIHSRTSVQKASPGLGLKRGAGVKIRSSCT